MYPGDGLWYEASIDTILPDGRIRVTFTVSHPRRLGSLLFFFLFFFPYRAHAPSSSRRHLKRPSSPLTRDGTLLRGLRNRGGRQPR